MVLYVIAGHGAGDPGACGNGYTEAERVRALASVIKERGGNSVVLLDTSRNWYEDKGINSLSIPSGDALIELHMDSGVSSARGGHVIIKAGIGGADQYDKALASAISSIFPGRAEAIVESSDLANPNRAYARGINYRLLECCFITNSGDVSTFNSRMTEVADAILASFGISANANNEEEIVTDTDIQKIADAVWSHDNGSWTADRVYRCTAMLKAMCGLGKDDTSDPLTKFDSIRSWTMGRLERLLMIAKGVAGIAQDDTSTDAIKTPLPVKLSDEDVKRIAEAVAGIMGK